VYEDHPALIALDVAQDFNQRDWDFTKFMWGFRQSKDIIVPCGLALATQKKRIILKTSWVPLTKVAPGEGRQASERRRE
jgi:hypothetical protein